MPFVVPPIVSWHLRFAPKSVTWWLIVSSWGLWGQCLMHVPAIVVFMTTSPEPWTCNQLHVLAFKVHNPMEPRKLAYAEALQPWSKFIVLPVPCSYCKREKASAPIAFTLAWQMAGHDSDTEEEEEEQGSQPQLKNILTIKGVFFARTSLGGISPF